MIVSQLLVFILVVGFSTVPLTEEASSPRGGLTALEWAKLQREKEVKKRIKIYKTASDRIFAGCQRSLRRSDYEVFQEGLSTWNELLTMSVDDIDGNFERGKKSKELIRYEIHLRKSISELEDWRYRLPGVTGSRLEQWLKRADDVHSKLVDILFQRE